MNYSYDYTGNSLEATHVYDYDGSIVELVDVSQPLMGWLKKTSENDNDLVRNIELLISGYEDCINYNTLNETSWEAGWDKSLQMCIRNLKDLISRHTQSEVSCQVCGSTKQVEVITDPFYEVNSPVLAIVCEGCYNEIS